jgi:hypothetical protein
MSHAVLRIGSLPSGALDAAREFHATWLEQALALLTEGPVSLVIVMPPAAYDHSDWRRAVARDLARRAAPVRVNVIAGDEAGAITSALAYLEEAPGVTGQYLPLDGTGAGNRLR